MKHITYTRQNMDTQISNFTINGVHLGISPRMIITMMRHILKYILVLATGSMAYGQMGINTTNPNASTVLDIRPDLNNGNMGVLLPRVSTFERLNPKMPPANRMLVIDTDLNMFMYYLDGTWYALNGFKTTVTEKSGVKDTLTKHTGTAVFTTNKPDSSALIVNGDTKLNGKVTVNNLTAQKVYGEGTMPVGAIIMWSGSINNIPQGWALCDGNGGRPNLQGRFIVGYDPLDPDYDAIRDVGPNFTDADGTSNGNSTQDAKQVRLLDTQSGLPSHTHEVIDKGHDHAYTDLFRNNLRGGGEKDDRGGYEYTRYATTSSSLTGISISPSISINASTSVENRPPYYVLAYIIKLNY